MIQGVSPWVAVVQGAPEAVVQGVSPAVAVVQGAQEAPTPTPK